SAPGPAGSSSEAWRIWLPVVEKTSLAIRIAQNEVHAADRGDHIGDQAAFYHSPRRLQIPKAGGPHENAIGTGGAVADGVIGQLPAGGLDYLIYLAFGHTETFRDDFEMVDQGLHLGLHL